MGTVELGTIRLGTIRLGTMRLGTTKPRRAQNLQHAEVDLLDAMISFMVPAVQEDTPPPHIPILFHDDFALVVDKPGGMLVHRSREAARSRYLLQTVRDQTGRYLYPVHRIDRAASGALAFGLSKESAAALQAALQAADAHKEYRVLVRGAIAEEGTSERPLTNRKTGVRQEACSHWRRIALIDTDHGPLSWVAVRITTGRRHQIRRHMAAMAHQVVGDTTYGKGRLNRAFRAEFGLPRMVLHAALLDLAHPSGVGRLRARAPLAADLRTFLRRIPGVDDAKLDAP